MTIDERIEANDKAAAAKEPALVGRFWDSLSDREVQAHFQRMRREDGAGNGLGEFYSAE